MAFGLPTPIIRIIDSARRAFRDAIAGAGGGSLRIETSKRAGGDIAAETEGMTSSAQRADRISSDVVHGPSGSEFKI